MVQNTNIFIFSLLKMQSGGIKSAIGPPTSPKCGATTHNLDPRIAPSRIFLCAPPPHPLNMLSIVDTCSKVLASLRASSEVCRSKNAPFLRSLLFLGPSVLSIFSISERLRKLGFQGVFWAFLGFSGICRVSGANAYPMQPIYFARPRDARFARCNPNCFFFRGGGWGAAHHLLTGRSPNRGIFLICDRKM